MVRPRPTTLLQDTSKTSPLGPNSSSRRLSSSSGGGSASTSVTPSRAPSVVPGAVRASPGVTAASPAGLHQVFKAFASFGIHGTTPTKGGSPGPRFHTTTSSAATVGRAGAGAGGLEMDGFR